MALHPLENIGPRNQPPNCIWRGVKKNWAWVDTLARF